MPSTTPTARLALAAALALTLGACSGSSDGEAADGASGSETAAGSLTFVANDQLFFEEDSKSVRAGTVNITLECGEAANHTIAIEGVGDGTEIAACAPGDVGNGSVELEPGEYTYFCTVTGHRAEGMEGTLTVEG